MKFIRIQILLGLLIISVSLFSQNLTYKEYIKQNLNVFDDNDTNIFKDNHFRMFVMGEYHYREENSDIFLKTIKNLYYNKNVRMIFMETSMAQGLIIQNYLKTGDAYSLDLISLSAQFPASKFEKLKEFYDELPDNDKFTVVGIDIDNYDIGTNFVYAVKLIFENKKIPKRLEFLLAKIPYRSLPDDEETKYIVNEICKDFQENKDKYKKLLKTDFNTYGQLLTRVKTSQRFGYYNYNRGLDSFPHTKRENFIYRNVLWEMEKNPEINYFGQFGLAHIGLTHFLLIPEEDNVESFVAKLNTRDDSPVKGKICSTAILYADTKAVGFNVKDHKMLYYLSQMMYAKSLNKNFPNKAYRLIKDLAEKDKTYLLKLNNKNSPFKEIAEKKFQYVIIGS